MWWWCWRCRDTVLSGVAVVVVVIDCYKGRNKIVYYGVVYAVMVMVSLYSRKLRNYRLCILWFLTLKVIYRPSIHITWLFITTPSFDLYNKLREYLLYWGCKLKRCFSASLYIFTLYCIWCFIFTHSLACAPVVDLGWAGPVWVLSICLFLLPLKEASGNPCLPRQSLYTLHYYLTHSCIYPVSRMWRWKVCRFFFVEWVVCVCVAEDHARAAVILSQPVF